jgi:TonB family protein
LLALFCVFTSALPLSNQEAKTFRGFTLVKQVTDYDRTGRALPALTETLYVSASGDWRYLGTYPNGQVVETIYLCGRGVFFSDHRNRQLVKFGDVGAGRPGPTTAERLQADPKFVRTEYVLGRLAYLHRQDTHGYVEETYFAPELGPFPFKRINYHNDYKRVEEPVSLTFGEPETSQLRGADYPLVEQKPTYDPKLGERIEEKPSPQYPSEARAAAISGEVVLQVVVDESGQVIRAAVVSNLPLLAEAALEAAYRARFAPAERMGKAVKVTGVITYQFSPR